MKRKLNHHRVGREIYLKIFKYSNKGPIYKSYYGILVKKAYKNIHIFIPSHGRLKVPYKTIKTIINTRVNYISHLKHPTLICDTFKYKNCSKCRKKNSHIPPDIACKFCS